MKNNCVWLNICKWKWTKKDQKISLVVESSNRTHSAFNEWYLQQLLCLFLFFVSKPSIYCMINSELVLSQFLPKCGFVKALSMASSSPHLWEIPKLLFKEWECCPCNNRRLMNPLEGYSLNTLYNSFLHFNSVDSWVSFGWEVYTLPWHLVVKPVYISECQA